ncbi:hypothetical protein GCM10025860_18250 [Methanobacterium ferruginis]|nr:hypothetical protein GCM10025860_18250 [Methanobacterium ferruginis]
MKEVELTKMEIEELQEKLIITYQFISQQNTFKRFYYQGIEVENDQSNNEMIDKLLELDDAEELLKSCIIELEDMKSGGQSLLPSEFQEFIMNQDWNQLYKKYGMKTPEDVENLDLEMLLELI